MEREDLITKNDAKYFINLAIERIEKANYEKYTAAAVLEILCGVKKDIDMLEPAKEPTTPCERDGHNFKEIFISHSYGTVRCYCTKCGQAKTMKF